MLGRAKSRIAMMLLIAAALSISSSPAASGPLALDPEAACSALKEVGLQARGGYRGTPGKTYRCDSRRKTILAGESAQDEISFSALGSEQAVVELRLELSVRSRGDFQIAHRKLAEYAGILTEHLLDMQMPKEVNDTILSAVNGKWSIGGHEFELRRSSVADGLYELRLHIR